jgi:imidazoleglycerol-phosphate dehydratase
MAKGIGAMEVRSGEVHRKTNETDIRVTVLLEGSGLADVQTGVGFFDHMLNHAAQHSLIDVTVAARGDLEVDDHHTVEDVGIALGKALAQALGDRAGITRYGHAIVPMDEAVAACALDISGRGLSVCKLRPSSERIGEFATELAPEFFRAVAHNAGITLHIDQLRGENSHHIVEAAFKAFGRALRQAVSLDERRAGVPSTKGVL